MAFKVDFIGIGAARSGSTWLADCLNEHPEIYIPPIKETSFFLKPVYEKKYTRDLKWYKSFFSNAPKDSILGEFTTHYMVMGDTAKLIKKTFPNVKILVCLRNPADMLHSFYWWRKASFAAKEVPATFEEAIEKDPIYKLRGQYYKQLKPFVDSFPKNRIKIIIFKDIQESPEKVLKSVYKFLGVNNSFIPPSAYKKVNTGRQIRSKLIASFVHAIVKISRKFDMHYYLRRFGNYGPTGRLYSLLTQKPKKYPKMHVSTRKKIIKILDKDISQVEKLLDRNLDFWKQID